MLRKSQIQNIVQYMVISTSFPPFTYFYRKIYELSTKVATLLLRRVDGVIAIYLRRGVAKGETVYGLSDIDLLIVVNGEDKEGYLTKERVRATYDKLSQFIPFFGGIDKELGLYSASEFFRLYDDYDFYKYRFNDGRYTWALLFGEDLVKALPRLEDSELYLPATEELKTWWSFLNAEFSLEFAGPQFKSKYLWYKAISEASEVYLFVCHGKSVRSREAALCEIKNYLSYEHQCHIDRIQSYLRHLTSKEDLMSDESMQLFITLVEKTFRVMENKVYGDAKGRKAIVHIPRDNDLISSCNLAKLLREVDTIVREELEPYLDHIALIPQVEFGLDVLNNSDIDSFQLVLIQNGFIPIKKLRRFRSIFVENSTSYSIEPFILTNGNIALSLQADKSRHCIKSPKRYPFFFSLLHRSAFRLSDCSFEESAERVHCYLPPDTFGETIKKRVVKINATILDRDIYKMMPLDFLRFFWAAARTKLLARSLNSLISNEIYIPLTSRQILEVLLESFPDDSDWLEGMHIEYNKELLGKENESHRFFSKSIALLNRM